MQLQYTLTVIAPDTIDGGVAAEILSDAEPHDATFEAKVRRWLGGTVSDAVSQLRRDLPQGWTASVADND